LNTYTSSSTLNVIIDTTLNTGTYYYKIEGTGNTYAPDYAIMGSYSVQGELVESPLPLHKLDLKGTFSQDRHILNWDIEADENVTKQILEISVDGKNFSQLVQPDNADRSYTYWPVTKAALYRVYAEFDNGSHYYSNIVAIRQPNNNYKPKLVNSLVTNDAITVTSPAIFDYTLFDLNGRVLTRGKVENGMNTITAGGLLRGMYLISFTDGEQQWTEKLVKQ
jgi:hypothetical protein